MDTGITRGKRLVVLVGTERAVAMTVNLCSSARNASILTAVCFPRCQHAPGTTFPRSTCSVASWGAGL